MKYQIQNKQTGIVITECSTLAVAEAVLQSYEYEDKMNGDYQPDFYDIVEIDHIQDYFENIMTRIESGHKEYALSLYSRLRKREKALFLNWLETTYFYESHDSGEHGSVAEITEILG